jgi:predicted enzyme related to lactoylglutathione lyase
MMPMLSRVLFNILSKDLAASTAFYRTLADFETIYESDWYVVLTPPGQPLVQIGLIDEVSEFTPRHAWGLKHGTFLTLVVEDVFEVLERARGLGAEVVSEPMAMDYGQTRALIRDPNGLIVDISTPTAELEGREDVLAVDVERSNQIDQQQPEDRGGPQPV